MWVYVLFDLPTNTKEERTQARKFREALLNSGFSMVQFSVYSRHCLGKEKSVTISQRIKNILPEDGKIDILTITDKQFLNIISYENKKPKKNQKQEQLLLF